MDALVATDLMPSTSCSDCSSEAGKFLRSRILQLRCKYGSQPAHWNTLEGPRLCSFKEWTYKKIRSAFNLAEHLAFASAQNNVLQLFLPYIMGNERTALVCMLPKWALESRVLCSAAWIYAVLPCIGFIVPAVLENFSCLWEPVSRQLWPPAWVKILWESSKFVNYSRKPVCRLHLVRFDFLIGSGHPSRGFCRGSLVWIYYSSSDACESSEKRPWFFTSDFFFDRHHGITLEPLIFILYSVVTKNYLPSYSDVIFSPIISFSSSQVVDLKISCIF